METVSIYDCSISHELHHKPENLFEKKEVGCYSQVACNFIVFDKRSLNPFKLPSYATLQAKKWNVKKGYRSFTYRIFKRAESMVKNLLLTTIKYESDHGSSPSFQLPQVLCHSGLFKDILADKAKYQVIPFDGQLIFVGTNRRYNQNLLISYSGIRFEDLLETGDPTIQTKNNFQHFKSLSRWKFRSQTGDQPLECLTVTEIDSLNPKGDRLNEGKKDPSRYTEIKMAYACPTFEYGNDVLDILRNVKRNFGHRLFQWVTQCKYGMSNYLLIGLRSPDYNIWKVQLYDIDSDVIPYLKKYFKQDYIEYQCSSDTLTKVLRWVKDSIEKSMKKSHDHDYHNVFELDIGNKHYRLKKLLGLKAEKAYNTAMINEFLEWRKHKNNILASSKYIFHKEWQSKAKKQRKDLQLLSDDFNEMHI
ncbi:hypothetical protein BRETT_002219 [Brettanomyces bruxellensis]|uniref:Decapping nuclease n=1 Tax=Dekkera bruxellensis TaxID=5007 RepID=A0A871RBN9_DEKBR|nr:uncharacterized protein BRETT_002219 [Brettanomyces bruxellensis]QOU22054.1 hypothetical protein BRETT_002219 [Brettanomyces bruxellensis]